MECWEIGSWRWGFPASVVIILPVVTQFSWADRARLARSLLVRLNISVSWFVRPSISRTLDTWLLSWLFASPDVFWSGSTLFGLHLSSTAARIIRLSHSAMWVPRVIVIGFWVASVVIPLILPLVISWLTSHSFLSLLGRLLLFLTSLADSLSSIY